MEKTRLDQLKEELETVKNLRCMSFDMLEKAIEYYEYEIVCIEKWGSPNPVYKD